jgi:hypothetical protein
MKGRFGRSSQYPPRPSLISCYTIDSIDKHNLYRSKCCCSGKDFHAPGTNDDHHDEGENKAHRGDHSQTSYHTLDKMKSKDGSGWDDGGQHHAGHVSQSNKDSALAFPDGIKVVIIGSYVFSLTATAKVLMVPWQDFVAQSLCEFVFRV